MEWANAKHGLDLAYFNLALARRSTKVMEEAITALRSALQVRTRELLPMQRAVTQDTLGRAYWSLGVRAADVSRLNKAIDAFKDAQEIRVNEAKLVEFEPFYSDTIKSIRVMMSILKDDQGR